MCGLGVGGGAGGGVVCFERLRQGGKIPPKSSRCTFDNLNIK